ncbi:MAG: hypothetical protein HY517_02505 [Candidatus Aenigmarchaeota archaeon]|nr:hypothetical protein [Candidatus Aenigmarchaeota archaeon]
MRLGKRLAVIASFYALANSPEAVRTYNLPMAEVRPTLSEHLQHEASQLFDISGGAVYVNFRLGGISAGYAARKTFME